MVIWRKSESDEFKMHCVYIFRLVKVKFDWQISGITQRVLWNEGTPAIHNGTQK